MDYKLREDDKPGMDDKQEPDYKSLYIDALYGLERAREMINKTLRDCKSRVGGDWYLEWLQTNRIVTNGGKDLTDEAIRRYKEREEREYRYD